MNVSGLAQIRGLPQRWPAIYQPPREKLSYLMGALHFAGEAIEA